MHEIERELSFCFKFEESDTDIVNFFQKALFNNATLVQSKIEILEDHYLAEDIRIRYLANPETYWFFKKTGDKATQRMEISTKINPDQKDDLMSILQGQVKLRIKKERVIYKIDDPDWANMEFLIDTITKPMRVKMVEIECDEPTYHRIAQYTGNIEGLKRNTRNAWSYFHRKIGFAGAPSSGKSTLCRSLVNKLSINYGISAEQITEYARTYIARYDVPEWYIQPLIEWGQERREEDAEDSVVMVTDSPRFLPYMYLMFNHKAPLDATSVYMYGKLYKAALAATMSYTDLILLKQQDIKNDGIRCQTNSDASILVDWMETYLKQHKFAFIKADYTLDLDQLIEDMFSLNTLPR